MRSGLKVVDAMTVQPVTATPDMSIRDIALLMETYQVSTIIIKEGKELLGLVAESDIISRCVLEGCDSNKTLGRKIMTSDIVTVSPGMDVFDALLLMRDTNVRTLPVMDEGEMVGLVTAKDILKLQPDLFENFVDGIRLREEDKKFGRSQDSAIVNFDEDE